MFAIFVILCFFCILKKINFQSSTQDFKYRKNFQMFPRNFCAKTNINFLSKSKKLFLLFLKNYDIILKQFLKRLLHVNFVCCCDLIEVGGHLEEEAHKKNNNNYLNKII